MFCVLDVRFVFYMSMPKSIESYYHKYGRGGRDGQWLLASFFTKTPTIRKS
jgi:bloom syndrome protein